MTQNTDGPDKVYQGPALSPHTDPGEPKLAGDGEIIAVPKPVQQDPTDIETLRAMYDSDPNVTTKMQTWFRIEDHEAQAVIRDERTPFEELVELGEYQALLELNGRVKAWMQTEAVEVRNLIESPDLNEEAINRKLAEGRQRRLLKAQPLYREAIDAERKLLKRTQPPQLEISVEVARTVHMFSTLVPLMTPEDTLNFAHRLADSNDPATQHIVPILRRLGKNPPQHWRGREEHVDAFLTKVGTSAHARMVALHDKAKEMGAHSRQGLRSALAAFVEDGGVKRTLGSDLKFGPTRRARRVVTQPLRVT